MSNDPLENHVTIGARWWVQISPSVHLRMPQSHRSPLGTYYSLTTFPSSMFRIIAYISRKKNWTNLMRIRSRRQKSVATYVATHDEHESSWRISGSSTLQILAHHSNLGTDYGCHEIHQVNWANEGSIKNWWTKLVLERCKTTKAMPSIFMVVSREIWKEQNAIMFRNFRPTNIAITRIMYEVWAWCLSGVKFLGNAILGE
jgi:hypothetical protein